MLRGSHGPGTTSAKRNNASMRLCLLSLLSLAMSALQRVDDASSGGAVIALNSTADDRPVWADGRLAVAVAAADGSLIELARPPQTTTLALTTARDDQPFVDVAVVAAARPTTRDAAILAVARVAVPAAPRGSVLVVASVRFRGTNVVIRAYDAADGGSRATAISRTGLALPDELPRPWRADVGGPHARVLDRRDRAHARPARARRRGRADDVRPGRRARVHGVARLAGVGRARAARGRHRPRERVVELGAGAGLAGLACKVLGAARVVLTDLPENLPLLQRNAARNGLDDVVVAPFDWLTPTTLGERFDVVLAADCVFLARALRAPLERQRGGRGARRRRAHRGHAPARADRRLLGQLRRRGWTASPRPRRRDAPQNTDVRDIFQVGYTKKLVGRGRRRTNDWGRD